MKAVIHHAYGAPEAVLSVQTVDTPVPKDDEVLVRVRAASMHPDVWHVIVGYPYVLRLMGNGVRKPGQRIPGTDLSGVVESAGRNVTRFKAGDEVFGESARFGWLNGGAYAEFVAVSQDSLALKPKNVTFEQAAAVPTAGTIALGNLGGARRPARRNVLINGAGGCMGPIALQIAKADGAHVTVVDCAEKLPMLRSLGADHVIDYRKEDYLKTASATTSSSMSCRSVRPRYQHALSPTGTYVPIGHAHYDNAGAASWATCRISWGCCCACCSIRRSARTSKCSKSRKRWRSSESCSNPESSPRLSARHSAPAEVPDALQWMREGHTPGRAIITP